MNSIFINLQLIFILFASCNFNAKDASVPLKLGKVESAANEAFNNYWYAGKAELNSYDLQQSRYGELREGEVVLIFVTEPFSQSKQVKLDNPKAAKDDMVSVMKLNKSIKFKTGIYDYSIFSSTFSPIEIEKYPYVLKSTTSMQEWCGNSFTQLNLEKNKYILQEFSYFESEGDRERQLNAAQLEDGLFTRIRLDKGQLPEGEIMLIPSTLYNRFTHKNLEVSKAKITKAEIDGNIKYTIDYSNIKRTLSIEVENKFPFRIMSWTEDNGGGLLTSARIKATTLQPYWAQKSLKDEEKRKELLQMKN